MSRGIMNRELMNRTVGAVTSALVLAGMLLMSAGCGSNKATSIDVDETEVKQPSGHEQALKKMNQKLNSR